MKRGLCLCCLLMLCACKVDLYSGLSEQEANQMLALLMLRHIDARKQSAKDGLVLLQVEKSQFVDAVEVLRQHGLPSPRRDGMSELFPAGQLVTSPVQEQAKMAYLKEQQLEKMLAGMDGVISAQVSIAQDPVQDGRKPEPSSVSVFIKYTPQINLQRREEDIRALLHDAVPRVAPENISVLLQPAAYRYQPPAPAAARGGHRWLAWLPEALLALAAALMLALLVTAGWGWRSWRKSK
ncbi:type III secretion system inner membrane ring lipoprotein SctJ [Paludibacterium yongneupense]|uniref:type III secretion system inner membrane ring lipoprotein SctJ n=1 Tax=Paludibacterium yongneupense TaxID=400061 RepID=UPI00041644D4|nr:type III secretion inner membrane ring lipoprotein SctJ [Paludibacterium yongneupense]